MARFAGKETALLVCLSFELSAVDFFLSRLNHYTQKANQEIKYKMKPCGC